jgi:DNA primase
MAKLVENSKPLVHLLWQREIEGKNFDSPERKAALDKSLREALGKITDASLRNHYTAEIKHLRQELFAAGRPKRDTSARSNGNWRNTGGKFQTKGVAVASTKNSLLAQSTDVEERVREAVILAILSAHPFVINEFLSELEVLDLHGPDHRAVLSGLLRHSDETDPNALRKTLDAELGPAPLEKLLQLSHVQIAPAVRAGANPSLTRMTLAEELAKLAAHRGVQREVADAVEDLEGPADEGLTWRVGQAAEARNSAGRGKLDDQGADSEDKGAMSDFLQSLIDGEVWVKKS